LKLISGVIQPSSGQLVVNGNIAALLELGSGLHPEFTGLQNIFFSGTMLGFTRKEMEEKIEPIVSFADIGDFIHQPLKTYSSGMKARLGFALAININPDILVLDEVLAVGDELFKRKCYAKMEELFESGCTVLYVSHAISSVNGICSRAILLDRGEMTLEGPPKLVTMYYQKYLFAQSADKENVRNEIVTLNKDQVKKKEFAQSVENSEQEVETFGRQEMETKPDENRQQPFFIPGFEPKSTVEYKNAAVDIYDIHIKTPDQTKVNALVTDEEYILSYKVKFNDDVKNVFSNIIFKTEKGFRLGSDVTPGRDKFLEGVIKGSVFLFEWHFRCRLLDGNYYLNVAVRSYLNGEYSFLSRIEDALVFKVQKDPGKSQKGITHMDQYAKISLLS
ncbi:MAG: ABC transporter ATP-binding protein, partial [bacterium]|nr:ABC transporter ATP-binding protein [bacterium]